MKSSSRNLTDADLIQIVDAALADVTRRSGAHLACRPGCAQCCVGAFAINTLDADRLRRGLQALETNDPSRASRLQRRISSYTARTSSEYPGDPLTGVLDLSDDGLERFEAFANGEACPVLDPETLTCDLYADRPMTCRVFGPPVRAKLEDAAGNPVGGLGVCELCFVDATPEDVAACELIADPLDFEEILLRQKEAQGEKLIETTVGYAFSTWIRHES